MEKRAVFRSAWLPYALVAPQLCVTLVFFIWPAAEALYQSLFVEDAFGTHVEFVGLANFRALLADPHYAQSFARQKPRIHESGHRDTCAACRRIPNPA